MTRAEVDEIILDVSEAFLELGTLEDQANIIYQRRNYKQPERTYQHEEDFIPVYTDYDMNALSLGQLDRKEAEEIGVTDDNVFKYYISGDQFTQYEENYDRFEPKNSDRILHRGVIYEVIRKKPILISESAILYLIFAKEAMIAVQSEEYRDQNFPDFEFDADREINSDTDESKRNLFRDLPAELKGFHSLPLHIWPTENKFVYSINGEEPIVFTLEPKLYTVETFLEEFTPEGLVITMNESEIDIKTELLGKSVMLNILFEEENIYNILGITAGTYRGKEVLRL